MPDQKQSPYLCNSARPGKPGRVPQGDGSVEVMLIVGNHCHPAACEYAEQGFASLDPYCEHCRCRG